MDALTGVIEEGLTLDDLARFGFRPCVLFRGHLVRLSRHYGCAQHRLRWTLLRARRDPVGGLVWYCNGFEINGPTNASDLTTLIWLVLGETP